MLPLLLLTIEDPDRRAEYAAAYEKYRQHMFVVANIILVDEAAAEDAVQNAFWSIIKSDSLPRVNAESPQTIADTPQTDTSDSPQASADDRLKAFLTIVVRNKAIDLLRSTNRTQRQDLTDRQLGICAPAGNISASPGSGSDAEEAAEVQQTVESLPAKYRDVLINYYYVGLSAKEIAQHEGVHHHTILRRLKKAEELFKEEYLKDR